MRTYDAQIAQYSEFSCVYSTHFFRCELEPRLPMLIVACASSRDSCINRRHHTLGRWASVSAVLARVVVLLSGYDRARAAAQPQRSHGGYRLVSSLSVSLYEALSFVRSSFILVHCFLA